MLLKGYARKLNPEEMYELPNTWYLSVMNTNKFQLVLAVKAKSLDFPELSFAKKTRLHSVDCSTNAL